MLAWCRSLALSFRRDESERIDFGRVEFIFELVNMLTWHAAPHIRAQVLSVGAGAGVLR